MTLHDDSRGERAMARLLRDAHLAPADRMPAIIADALGELGGRDVLVLIVDHQQTQLLDLAGRAAPLALEGSLPGRAFRHGNVERLGVEGGERIWVPLLDGIERVGLLGVTHSAVDDALIERTRRIASLAAELLVVKALYSDAPRRRARTHEMTLAAEMQWELIPPLTAGTERVTVAAMLEPAYSVGGDVFDYSLEEDLLRLSIMDAMGHGLGASVCSSLAVGAYRSARRESGALEDCAAAIEGALHEQFGGDRFVTAILAELDTRTGLLRWLNAGHPPPLLLREGRVVKELSGLGTVPLGLDLAHRPAITEEQLQPGDRVLFYTDGIVEHRPAGGRDQFGVEGITDFLVRADAVGEDLPETMRRLSRTLVDLHGGQLRDDASQLLVEWRGGGAQEIHRRFAGTATA